MKRNCPVCGGQVTKVLYSQRFRAISDEFPIKDYDVVVCQECGFGYADNVPEQNRLDVYYEELSKYENKHQAGKCSDEALANYQLIVDGLEAFLPDKDVRIADIGCATGGLLSVFQRNGYSHVAGVDPSPSCAKTAMDLYGIPVLNRSIFNVEPPEIPYDVLILSSVMEHIVDLEGGVRRMRAMLSPGGTIYIEVPDTVNFATFISAPFQQFSVEHVNFFAPASLANLMSRHGFDPVALWHDIRQLGGVEDPALAGVFRIAEKPAPATARDFETEPALSRYIGRSLCDDSAVIFRIDSLVKSRLPILVWGVGTQAQRLLATTRLGDVQIQAFVDSNPNYQGQHLNGVPIIAPEDIHKHAEPILIASRVYQEEIAARISDQYRCGNEVIRLFDLPEPGAARPRPTANG